jgi:cytochrome c oxidase subunit 4
MEVDSPEEFKKHTRSYLWVFAALMVFTVITVWAASWKVALPAAIVIALCIASVKAGLVAAFFMHLKGERPLITYCLLMTMLFFFGLIFLPLFMLLLTISDNAG